MNTSIKPRVIISKCIEFNHCRYNGQIISSNQIKELKPFIEFLPVCPEVEIGLGIPREPIRIVYQNKQQHLLQPKTNEDITNRMNDFTSSFLKKQKNIDGFILKSRSPSCGLKDVKIYSGEKTFSPIEKNAGLFGRGVLEKFPTLAIEDEGRLRNPTIREHFLRRIYTFARFRAVKDKKSLSALIQFHTKHKFLLMAYNQSKLKDLGQFVATAKQDPIKNVLSKYENILHQALIKSPHCSSNINILQHSFGYVSNGLSSEEKNFFLEELEKYRQAKISLASLISLLKSWIIRFNQPYLKDQVFFSPYPDQLVHADEIDSCESRNYWQ